MDLISRLSELRGQYNCFDESERDAYHTLSEAIKALSDVPDTNVGDKISRQAAIDSAERESQVDGAYGYMDTKSIVDMLNDLPSTQPDCSDCIKHGGDWDCDHVLCHKGKQPDNDMIHLQKEQAYLQGWEEGRKALREEIWEDGRDRLD